VAAAEASLVVVEAVVAMAPGLAAVEVAVEVVDTTEGERDRHDISNFLPYLVGIKNREPCY
jgi:hypothetical protein